MDLSCEFQAVHFKRLFRFLFVCVCCIFCASTIASAELPPSISSDTASVNVDSSELAFDRLETLSISAGSHAYHLSQYIEYWEDISGELTFDDILENKSDVTFQRYDPPSQHENFGANTHFYWLRFHIANNSTDSVTALIELINPILDLAEITIYEKNLGDAEVLSDPKYYKVGNDLAFSQRDIKTYSHVVKYKMAANREATVVIRAKSRRATSFPVAIYTGDALYEVLFVRQLVNGVLMGIMLGLLAYNGFVYFSTRTKSYRSYIFLAALMVLSAAARNNYLYPLWPDSVSWNHLMHPLMPLMMVVAYSWFSRNYLELPKYLPRLNYVVNGFVLYTFLGAYLLCFHLEVEQFKVFYIPVAMTAFVIYIVAGVLRLLQGFNPAKAYIVGTSIFILVGLLQFLVVSGEIEASYYTSFAMNNADMLLLIILSLGLVDRVNLFAEERNNSKKEAVKAETENEEKSHFLARMSHEIRTPMNGVLGTTELLASTELDETQEHYVEVINNSGHALLTIINDILDFTNIEEGRVNIVELPFSLEKLLADCAEVFALTADSKQLRFICSIKPETPDCLIGDPLRLRQVLLNLIGNAFKFTHEGEVSVYISNLDTTVDGECFLTAHVRDTGIGITEAQQIKLFNAFSQAEKGTAKEYGGTGLGLSISKQLLEIMGGVLGVKSTIEVGSEFYFTIPLKIAEPEEIPLVEQDSNNIEVLRDKHLLLVDSNETFIKFLSEQAPVWGMKVDCALGGQEAMKVIDDRIAIDEQVDIVCVGVEINDMSVHECMDKLRSYSALSESYFVKLNSVVQKELEDRVELSRIALQMPIPPAISVLKDELVRMLSEERTSDKAQKQQAENSEHMKTFENEGDPFHILVAEDNPINQKVIMGMLNKLKLRPVLTTNGMEAVETYRENIGKFDAILMDCEMPKLDGYRATKAIRKIESEYGEVLVPIVAVSAHALPEHVEQSFSVGMNAHISKPISLTKIRDVLCEVLKYDIE